MRDETAMSTVVAARIPPCWPALPIALVCALCYAWIGTGGSFRFGPSRHTHQSLTAAAWLKGRAWCTAEEVERQFYIGQFFLVREPVMPAESTPDLRRRYREFCLRAGMLKELRARSIDPTESNIEAHFRGHLERGAYHDWVRDDRGTADAADDRYFAYWPPLSAVLMLPLVALFGPTVSDVLVANLLGGLSAGAIYLMLRAVTRLWPAVTASACFVFALAYGIGTCHFYQAAVGQTWALVQLTATLMLILAITAAFTGWNKAQAQHESEASAGTQSPPPLYSGGAGGGWFALAAGFLALAFLARSTLILAAPFLFCVGWVAANSDPRRWSRFLKHATVMAVVLAAGIAIQLGFNQARFGAPLDFGQGRLADSGGHPRFAEDYRTYGRFHSHYVPLNLWYYFLNMRTTPHVVDRRLSFDGMGNSVAAVSPFLLFALLAWRRRAADELPLPALIIGMAAIAMWLAMMGLIAPAAPGPIVMEFIHYAAIGVVIVVLAACVVICLSQRDPLLTAVLLGALPGTAALMFFHATGWYQFGQRYLLDTMPFLLLLAVFGVRGRVGPLLMALVVIAVMANAWGAQLFWLKLQIL